MAEGIRELNLEEMAKISGGNDSEEDEAENGGYARTRPYCKGCRMLVQLIGSYYICDTVGCKELSVRKTASQVDWR